jgi:hypothetical protein
VSNYQIFNAADETAAAFGVSPTGLAAVPAVPSFRDDIHATEMTKVFGQVCRPRKIPL